ncbi:flagellin [Paenalcaligenes hominis]|uniref:flagellin N-terminal helical domain-containing protein n=1 Tax=Paenalcaligenes hominis TaxID=643674 RepID=UPI003524E445
MAIIKTNIHSLSTQNNKNQNIKNLSTAIERLASGKRINSAKDDAAGLAISNRMTATIRANTVVNRGINDGISLIQTAEGGLNSINHNLQRARELAVYAANETLNPTDRAIINLEYKTLLAEIDHVAMTTEIFGKYPLASGTLSEENTGSLGKTISLSDAFGSSGTTLFSQPSGIEPVAFIPIGAKNVHITVDGLPGAEDDIQIFTRNGKHLIGTPLDDYTWKSNGVLNAEDVRFKLFQIEDSVGFYPDAEYDDSSLLHYEPDPSDDFLTAAPIQGSYGGMLFTYSGDGDRFSSDTDASDGSTDAKHTHESVTIDEVTEPLLLAVTGQGIFNITATWDSMPKESLPSPPSKQIKGNSAIDIVTDASYGNSISKVTIHPTPSDHISLGLENIELDPIEKAREALSKLSEALEAVNHYRSQYGSLENRFTSAINTIETATINTEMARSRITDADYALETSNMTRAQIIDNVANSVLAQANQTPQIALELLKNL